MTGSTWYVVEMRKLGVDATLEVWDGAYTSMGTASMTLDEPSAVRNYFHPYLKRNPGWNSGTSSGEQEWSLVRRYTSPEPTTSVGPEEPG